MVALPPKSLHSAEGQMLGYMFQIEKAMLWLSCCDAGGTVAIEMEDDVVIRLQRGEKFETIFEQDKSTIGKGNPYNNRSLNLWKTLCIWLELISSEKVKLETSRFILATTSKIPANCLARQISNCGTVQEAQKVYAELQKINEKPSKTLKPFTTKFFSFPKRKILRLLQQVSLMDNEYDEDRKTLKDTIRNNLKIHETTPFNEIYWDLVGVLFDKTIEAWINGENAIFSPEFFWNRKDIMISKFKEAKFIERTKASLPIHEVSIQAQRGKYFVKQMETISAHEGEIIAAINDYLRASIERTRYAEEGRVTKQEFEDFDNDLEERWTGIFNRKTRLNPDEEDEDLGYNIFSETIDFKGVLAGIQTQQYYTTKGAYQKLSNEKQIGWHPNWKTLI